MDPAPSPRARAQWTCPAGRLGPAARGGFIGLALARHDPTALYAFLPADMGYGTDIVDRLWSSPEARQEFLARDGANLGQNSFFGSYLFANNTRVGLLSFATGILAGIPTALLMLYNGLILGAFVAVFLQDAWPITFAAWILPHAIPELTRALTTGASRIRSLRGCGTSESGSSMSVATASDSTTPENSRSG